MSDQPADDAVASARLVVAYVSEDDELDHVRDAALEIGKGGAKVILYARDHCSDLILRSSDLEDPGLGERLKGETVDNAVEEATETAAGLAVVLVAPDGSTELAAGRL